ncbi:hypothetical protein PAHAL_3G108100 [Panicum hallii]|uniref:Uncharacterized protein n=1 Tax=Panicum hallii TaxID=206008 RepID=A0A2T8KHS4_9POAL|nr:hypothetical protein PAHAL_3G108100 [Panicum hallii]
MCGARFGRRTQKSRQPPPSRPRRPASFLPSATARQPPAAAPSPGIHRVALPPAARQATPPARALPPALHQQSLLDFCSARERTDGFLLRQTGAASFLI